MPACFSALGLGAHQAEHHVGLARGRGPDLLAVDHPLVAVETAVGAQAGEVAAGRRLAVALAPDHLAADGGADPAALLLLVAVVQHGGHEHRDALALHAAEDAGARELLVDDDGLEQVGLGAEAAVLAGTVRAA